MAYEKLAVRFQDSDLATALEVITITVTGANDAPVITTADQVSPVLGDTRAPDTFAPAVAAGTDGTFAVTDADADDTLTFTMTGPQSAQPVALTAEEITAKPGFTHKVAGAYGTLYYHDTSGKWDFTPDADAINMLDAGDAERDVFSVTVSDGTVTSAAKTITINVNGFNDYPVQLADITVADTIDDTPFTETSFAPLRGTFPATTDPEGMYL